MKGLISSFSVMKEESLFHQILFTALPRKLVVLYVDGCLRSLFHRWLNIPPSSKRWEQSRRLTNTRFFLIPMMMRNLIMPRWQGKVSAPAGPLL